MRLICPNCGAQYEVDARVIPDAGRDVQCSNCGHTWFQGPPELDTGLAEELGYDVPQADATVQTSTESGTPDQPQFDEAPLDDVPPEPAIEPTPAAEAEAKSEPEPELAPEAPLPDEAAETRPELSPEPSPEPNEDSQTLAQPSTSTVKDSVRDILRAEVAFDQSMRSAGRDQIETQPDLGLEEPDQTPAKKSLRDRMARLRGLDPSDPGIPVGSAAATSGKRRDLLPDIEEINSTLSASSERDEDGTVPDEDTRRTRAERSGFRTGFFLLIFIAALLVALYIFAPLIAQKFPALAPILESYVAVANGFRIWLDTAISGASARLNGLLSQLGG